MSWWVYLKNAGPVDCIQEGGTQCVGGTDEPELNITYNYGKFFRKNGIILREYNGSTEQHLHGKRAGDTIRMLQAAVDNLGIECDHDYWKPTLGNAGFALNILLGWAKKYPDGKWEVS